MFVTRLKGLGHRMNIGLKEYFLNMRKWFSKFVVCHAQEKNKYNVSGCFYEKLTNSKN